MLHLPAYFTDGWHGCGDLLCSLVFLALPCLGISDLNTCLFEWLEFLFPRLYEVVMEAGNLNHTTAFRHPQPMLWPRIQCLDDLCRPQLKAKDKTCGVTSKSLGNDLGSGSLRCLCSWSVSSWWSWWYCWDLACQILSQSGWVPTPSGEFQRGFYLYLFKFHLLENLQANHS